MLHLQIKFILSLCETEAYLEDPKELEWEFEHEEQTGHILTVLWKVWSLFIILTDQLATENLYAKYLSQINSFYESSTCFNILESRLFN